MISQLCSTSIIGITRVLAGGTVRWEGCAPNSEGARIYVANHTSHLDFPLILAALPPHLRERTSVVAAADYWRSGSIRRRLIEQAFCIILVERDHVGRHFLDQMTAAIDRGESLILFPEGTRGAGDGLRPFKCGIYHLAHAKPEVEIVPVWIDNAYRVLPKGSLIPGPMECSVTFGEPTHLLPNEGKKAFLERLATEVHKWVS